MVFASTKMNVEAKWKQAKGVRFGACVMSVGEMMLRDGAIIFSDLIGKLGN
jgi:hypothetical protein